MEVEDDKKRKIYDLLQGFCIYNIKFDGRPNQNCGCLCLSKLIGLCPLVTSSVYLKYIKYSGGLSLFLLVFLSIIKIF